MVVSRNAQKSSNLLWQSLRAAWHRRCCYPVRGTHWPGGPSRSLNLTRERGGTAGFTLIELGRGRDHRHLAVIAIPKFATSKGATALSNEGTCATRNAQEGYYGDNNVYYGGAPRGGVALQP